MADAVGAILLAGITLYAVLGGADFGGGLWDLLAGTTARGRAPRDLIDESITPVWEANHVWLVFDLVIFWTAFPHAFASVMTALALPLWLALAGIVLRGAGFAFRKEIRRLGQQRAAGAAVVAGALSLAALAALHGSNPALFDRLTGRALPLVVLAGATQATFVALVVVSIAAVILVVPSFALLFRLQGRRMLGGGEQGTRTPR